eukprot:sb/3470561/
MTVAGRPSRALARGYFVTKSYQVNCVVVCLDYYLPNRDITDHVTHLTSTLCVCHVIRFITHFRLSPNCNRERDRERDRERERKGEREKDRKRERKTERERERQKERGRKRNLFYLVIDVSFPRQGSGHFYQVAIYTMNPENNFSGKTTFQFFSFFHVSEVSVFRILLFLFYFFSFSFSFLFFEFYFFSFSFYFSFCILFFII